MTAIGTSAFAGAVRAASTSSRKATFPSRDCLASKRARAFRRWTRCVHAHDFKSSHPLVTERPVDPGCHCDNWEMVQTWSVARGLLKVAPQPPRNSFDCERFRPAAAAFRCEPGY